MPRWRLEERERQVTVGTILSSLIGVGGSLLASGATGRATDKATATQLEMYEKTRKDLLPYNEVGKAATYTLASLYGLPGPDGEVEPPDYAPFMTSPDYQFARAEGINALDASAAARGNLLSGGMMKELTEYGAGLASQNYGNYVNRLTELARLGENAGAQTGAFGVNIGNNIAGNQLAAGEATSSGILGATGSIQGGIQNYLRDYYQSLGANAGGSAYQGTNPVPTGELPYNYRPW